jgi:predicted enzyme related to lactoylglutathione lyase
MPDSQGGKFVWYELMTSDPNAAQSFYHETIGWDTAPFEESPEPYTMWMNSESPVGGVMALPEEAKQAGAPPHWIAYITTPNVDETTNKVKELGGNLIHGPMEIPNVGRFAIVSDPQGAVFAVYKPANEQPGDAHDPGVGEFSWHELATTDHEGAFEFYSNLFGWSKTEAMDMGEAGTYQMYGLGDKTMGGIYNKPAEMPGPPMWLYYTVVPDVNEAAEKVKAKGGQVLNGPMEVPGGSGDMIAQCMDPQGAPFAIHSHATG